MKKIQLLFIVSFFILSCNKKSEKKIETATPVVSKDTITQVKNKEATITESKEVIFTVQIAALKNSNDKLLNIVGIETYKEGALTKYRLGNFTTYKEARAYRLQLLNEYEDAFVQALKNDTPITIQEALQN